MALPLSLPVRESTLLINCSLTRMKDGCLEVGGL